MTLTFKTPAELRKGLEKVLGWNTSLALFPVRHHSPTCALKLDKWLRKFKPDAVLIEGPAAYNDRIDILSDPKHQAPFALVASARKKGDVLGRAYYPFCDYSPELVALRWAREAGAKAEFIDLVYGERGVEDFLDAGPDDAPDLERHEDKLGAAEDGPLARSRFTQELVKRAGCRDFDEVWEALFEQQGWDLSPEDWALDVLAYSHLSRVGYRPEELEADGTLAREACMARHMEDAAKKYKKVAVITGAFHTAALRESTPEPARARTKAEKADIETDVYLATYSFPRLDALLGYASGMAGPAFYQHIWDHKTKDDPFAIAAQRVLVEASRLARRDGETLGTADAIGAAAFAVALAEFRGRVHVGRVEVVEAAQTSFVKGDAQLLGRRVLGAIAETLRGTRVGKLGESAGQSVLVLDFQRQLDQLRLPLEHGRPQDKALDLYGSELDLARSRFFQQCKYLELDFAECLGGPNLVTGEDLTLKMENWRIQYTPEIETRLTELAVFGATLEDVATSKLIEEALSAENKSAELTLAVVKGLVMGLHRPVERLIGKLAQAMFADDDVLSLLRAGATLRTVMEGRERLEAASVDGIPQLAQQAFMQGALRLERLANISPDQVESVLGALSTLLDVVLTQPKLAPPRDLLLSHAIAGREAARLQSPAVLGALDGFLLQLGEGDLAGLAKRIVTLAQGKTRIDGVGSYLEGVISASRQALLGEGPLFDALIGFIRDTEWEDFLASLPSLRRALTRLSPRETESVAERAAKLFGITKSEATALFGASPEVVARLGQWEQGYVADERRWAADAVLTPPKPSSQQNTPEGA